MTSGRLDPCQPVDADLHLVTMLTLQASGARGALPVRLYTPPATTSDRLIVFFPPGGFVENTIDDLESFVQALALRTGCKVLASPYTLADEAPFPAAAEDAHAVLTWVAKSRKLLDWLEGKLIVAGIEAGGNLAAVVSLMARDRGQPQIDGQMLVTPMLDPELSTGSMRAMAPNGNGPAVADACAAGYRGYLANSADRIHPYASPLQSSRLKGLPPTLILSAEDDALRDEAERYGARLLEHGVATTLVRLPPLHIQDAAARCDAVRIEGALRAMAEFVQTVN